GVWPHIRRGYESRRRSHNCRLAPDKRRKRSRPGFEPTEAAWGEETICTMRLKVVVPHRKERGHSNGRYHDWRSWNHPTRRSERRRTLSSEELGDEIRLLPGRPRTPKSSPSSIRSLRSRLDWWLWCCRG